MAVLNVQFAKIYQILWRRSNSDYALTALRQRNRASLEIFIAIVLLKV